MAQILEHCRKNKISLAQLAMANETSVSGKSEAEVNAHLDKILGAMRATVKTGIEAPTSTLPGPIKLQSKAATVYKRSMEESYQADRGIGKDVGHVGQPVSSRRAFSALIAASSVSCPTDSRCSCATSSRTRRK